MSGTRVAASTEPPASGAGGAGAGGVGVGGVGVGGVTEFRATLRRFLTEHHPGKAPRDRAERLRWQRDWAAHLVDHGFAGPSWPREWGGMDLPLGHQLAYHEEVAAAGVPRHPSPNVLTVGPTIIRHGTPEQQQRFLRPMLRADELWAQGFSEPDAGSDLPSLRTRAVRDGSHYVVTGRKIWSSKADVSDWMFALVRTGEQSARQHGITYLLLDLASPGVTVTPVSDLTRSSEFCEVVLEEVRVPVDQRVGEENGGWAIARTSLGHERSVASVARASGYRRVVDELVALARQRGVTSDPVVRQRLADAETRVRLLWFNSVRILSTVMAGSEPGPVSSVSRLFHAQFEQELHELAVALLGPYGTLATGDPHSVQRGRWVWGFLRTRASTIGAGTAEIQRNTVAERVLGLPREPREPRGAQ